jgi:hypothetical protein
MSWLGEKSMREVQLDDTWRRLSFFCGDESKTDTTIRRWQSLRDDPKIECAHKFPRMSEIVHHFIVSLSSGKMQSCGVLDRSEPM